MKCGIGCINEYGYCACTVDFPCSVCPNAILDSEKEKPSQATVYEWTFKTEKGVRA
jgi:hypothetical protein